MGAFKAYDIRGIYKKDIDEDLAYRVGFFLPKLLKTDKVLVGRDVRTSSESLFENLKNGILDSGATCIDLGLATTPYVYFSTVFLGVSASVQITASHNGPEYNGFKISTKNALPVGENSGLRDLEELVSKESVHVASRRGDYETAPSNTRQAYLNYQNLYMRDLSNLRVSFDLSNGMATLFAREIFGSKNRNYILDYFDGTFPYHEPNPLIEENCEPLKKVVLDTVSDVGVIFDGDADRVVFVDDLGRFIQPDYITALIGYYYKNFENKSGYALCDIRTSKSTLNYLSELGFKTQIWKVGHAYAKRKLRELNGVFGGELAGHYYFRDFSFCDSAIHAAILVLDVVSALKDDGIKLSEFINNLVKYSNSGEVNFKLEQKDAAIEKVISKYAQDAQSIMDFDGIRYDFGSWWFNIRKSNTEPYLRLIVEADNAELCQQKLEELSNIIKSFN